MLFDVVAKKINFFYETLQAVHDLMHAQEALEELRQARWRPFCCYRCQRAAQTETPAQILSVRA